MAEGDLDPSASLPTGLVYPASRTVAISKTLASLSFADPYAWLEEETAEVREWQEAQAKLASAYAHSYDHFERLTSAVERFAVERRVVLPRFANGSWFRIEMAEGAAGLRAVVADRPLGPGRILFDASALDPERPPFLSWISPSPDARFLAFGLCTDGSENNAIHILEVSSGRLLENAPSQIMMDNWTGGVQWLADSSGFFFSAISGAATDFEQAVFLHHLASDPPTRPLDIEWQQGTEYRMVVVSRDGRYAVAVEGLDAPIPVAIAELGRGTLSWTPFVTHVHGTVAGHVIGDRYVAVTDIGAARGRLVSIDLRSESPNDPSTWRELVAETNAVMRTVTPVGDLLYLTEYVDTYARVRIVDRQGLEIGLLPLPGKGAISEAMPPFGNLVARGHPDRFLFAFSTLTSAWGLYCHEPGSDRIEELRPPAVRLGDAIVEDHWAVSADGTRIPYHLVRPDRPDDGPRPTLIYAYGGFNAPLMPQFPGTMAAFVAEGGILVHAHLRGGGEFGRDWWEGGRFRNKQNSYDDLYAIAEDLIAKGWCTSRTLSVTGASNGGLTAAVAAIQRPDLWGAVVPRVPRLDLIGACDTPYGRLATVEDRICDLDDPVEVQRLASYSPYHQVRDGEHYPAIYLAAGGSDPRCPPGDARKFAARMQTATGSSAPVLLHVWPGIGHGGASSRDAMIEEHGEWLAFLLRTLSVWKRTEAG